MAFFQLCYLKMKYRKTILLLHKILGLAAGIVVFVVAITGCCWSFKDEIESLYDDYKYVRVEESPIITPTQVKQIAQGILPNNTIHGTLYPNTNAEAVEVIFYDAEPEFYTSVFLNPYSGEVIKIKDHLSGFFAFILKGHMRLWFPKAIGEHIVGVSILLFIAIIISGFFLWIPKRKKNLKQRLKFNWKPTTRWKRKNFDLHAIIGFYISFLALIIAFTGSIMSYNWLRYVVYKSTGGSKEVRFVIPENESNLALKSNTVPMDFLIEKLKTEIPEAESFELHYPETDSLGIYVEVSNSKETYYDSDYRFFDQNTLKELETKSIYGKYKNAGFADKLQRMNYDIHIGAIGGLAGKIIAFLVSLLVATLPVTGVLLWYGRTYKKKTG